jgi:hypothetical protein
MVPDGHTTTNAQQALEKVSGGFRNGLPAKIATHEVSQMSRHVLAAPALGALFTLLGANPASGHHSFAAEFDIDQPIQLRGEVIRMEFTNPHSWIYLRVTTDGGDVQEWAIEGGAPNALIRRGWNRDSLPPGTEVTVLGYRSKDGALRASGGAVTLPDGSSLDVASSGVGAPSR